MLLNINIVTEYSLWLVPLCVLVALIYAYVLYKNESRFDEVNHWLKRLMFGLRLVLVSILCFLLLSPLIKTIYNSVEKPLIIIAQDNSTSILLNKDSTFYKTTYQNQIEDLKLKLSENYKVRSFAFDNNLKEDESIDFTGKMSNLSNVFDDLENRFYNQNLGAIILASDGIFNEGANPVYSSQINGVPVYAIALGDTTPQKDVILKDVVLNKFTFLGNQFPIEINATIQEGKGSETKLEIFNNGKLKFEKKYNVNSSSFSINENVLLEAKDLGVQKYEVKLSPVKGEMSIANNTKSVYIEVLDGRQEILILANAPHPDLKALKLSIESNENYKVNTQFLADFNGNVEAYSLVIVHQIVAQKEEIIKKLQASNVSLWYIIDSKLNTKVFNGLNTGLELKNTNGQSNQVLPLVNEQFPLFSLTHDAQKYINKTSPLLSAFGTFIMKEKGYSLLYQKIGAIETESPLMSFFHHEDKKVAVLIGEGIWRWRILEFNKTKKHEAVNELISKTVQFLSVKEDKSKFRLITKNNFLENEEVRFNAELYNDSYELNNTPDINLQVKNERGETFNFVFNKTSSAYFLNAGIFNAGEYSYMAKVNLGNKEYVEEGTFQVEQIQIESKNTIANHQLLANMVKKHHGKMFYPSNIGKIPQEIELNNNITSIIYEKKELKELINLKWIFLMLLLLLSAEWFLRKRNGAY